MGRTQRKRLQQHRHRHVDCSNTPEDLLALLKYLCSKGWRNETQLIARCFPQTGRGLCSKRSIRIGETLMKMPLKTLVTIATIEDDSDFKGLFDDTRFCQDVQISFQSLMAFYLQYHKQLSSKSPLEAVVNSIPSSFSTPYFCLVDELHCLPEEILEKTVEQNKKIRRSFQNLEKVAKDQEYFHQHFNITDFKCNYFAVNSRCVYVPSREFKHGRGFFDMFLGDETNLAMAPFLDLFNHSDKVETRADLVPSLEKNTKHIDYVLTLQSSQMGDQPSYTQLFISYGALPNFKLFTEYGFILSQNQHDYFEFSLHDVESLIRVDKSFVDHTFHRNKFKFIREHNLADQMFIQLRNGASHNLRVVLHLLFKEKSHFPNILNQVAFGDVSQFEDVEDILEKLVYYKITEYNNFIANLKNLTVLSSSGSKTVEYLNESVRYFEKFLNVN